MHSNTEEFRTAALHFEEYGVYTLLPENGHRNSQFMKFWDEEERRCIHGYHIGRDYIPGYFYFYLNYCPILITRALVDQAHEDTDKTRSERVLSFPEFWDTDYDYYNYLEEAEKRGEHGVVLKTRGRGYSFKGASMLNRNYFLIPRSKSYAVAYEKEYLIADGLLTKAWDMMDFIDENTIWAKRRQYRNTDMHKRASYEANLSGIKVEKGYKSEILGLTLRDNPNRIRGKRGKLILFEEAGKFPGLLKSWQIARNSMEQGSRVYGLMIAFGTGGTEGADFTALEELFRNPKGYNIHGIPNKWSEYQSNTKVGFFVAEYESLEGFYDKEGNSDRVKAKEYAERERKIVQDNSKDPSAYTNYVAEKPFTPEEATLNFSLNNFPVLDLKNRLAELEMNATYRKSEFVVDLLQEEDGSIKWQYSDKKPIRSYPYKDKSNQGGAIIIYEWPFKDPDGEIPPLLYIAGIDPYNQDESQTESLGACFIMNRLTERIVAEYVGRPVTAHAYYEELRKLLIFYNARANYENDVRGLFDYFSSKNCLFLLADEPRIIKDIIQDSQVRRKKGTHATPQINQYGRELIKKWMLSDIPGETDKSTALNLHKIRSEGLLREAVSWNTEGNFDRISALGMLMILRQDLIKIEATEKTKKGRLPNDPFWNKFRGKPKRAITRATFSKLPARTN